MGWLVWHGLVPGSGCFLASFASCIWVGLAWLAWHGLQAVWYGIAWLGGLLLFSFLCLAVHFSGEIKIRIWIQNGGRPGTLLACLLLVVYLG